MKIGIQNSVMGWDDPFHLEACESLMRTGEGKWFPSQDTRPTKEELIKFVKDLGVDFYLQHVMPIQDEVAEFSSAMETAGLDFMFGNEFGNINGPHTPGTNRYDIPKESVDQAQATGRLLGIIYDESEHLQLHPHQYKGKYHQWAEVEGKTLQQIEDDIVAEVSKLRTVYGHNVPLYGEHVFPVMYHTLARGGMNPCPKLLKEEFQSLQLATALGAAKQYNCQLGICVDLWGQDVGPWFTRIWGFPGHSPEEYKTALEIAYLMGPDLLFTENIDVLAVHKKSGFAKTEFGDIFEEFVKGFVPANPLLYNHKQAEADVVVIRSDDTDWKVGGTLYGSNNIPSNKYSQSVFQVFHLLSRGALPTNGLTFFLPQFEYVASKYERNQKTLEKLPLLNGVKLEERSQVHPLFYPLPNTLVLDERATSKIIGNPKLIIIAGSRMTHSCLQAVAEKVRLGAVCVAAEWLMPEGWKQSRRDGEGRWIVTNDFSDANLAEQIDPLLGEKNCWRQRFGEYEVRFYNPNGDQMTIVHEITKKRY